MGNAPGEAEDAALLGDTLPVSLRQGEKLRRGSPGCK